MSFKNHQKGNLEIQNPDIGNSENLIRLIKTKIEESTSRNSNLSELQKSKWRKIVHRVLSPWPAWAVLTLIEELKLQMPTVRPAEFRLIGRRLEKFDFFPLSKSEILICSKIAGHCSAGIPFLIQKNQNKELIEAFETQIANWMPQWIKWFNSLPLDESQKYLEAFTKARGSTYDFHLKPKGLKTNSLIYGVILRRWAIIETFDSIPELHAYLCKELPAGTVGNAKRLEAICRRIGLKFRQRGRPRKS